MYSMSQKKDVHKALLEKREKEYLSLKKRNNYFRRGKRKGKNVKTYSIVCIKKAKASKNNYSNRIGKSVLEYCPLKREY